MCLWTWTGLWQCVSFRGIMLYMTRQTDNLCSMLIMMAQCSHSFFRSPHRTLPGRVYLLPVWLYHCTHTDAYRMCRTHTALQNLTFNEILANDFHYFPFVYHFIAVICICTLQIACIWWAYLVKWQSFFKLLFSLSRRSSLGEYQKDSRNIKRVKDSSKTIVPVFCSCLVTGFKLYGRCLFFLLHKWLKRWWFLIAQL